MVRFTVFTPTFNREQTLARVWTSLLSQTYSDFEWLVVDDGSTDGTQGLIEKWAQTAKFPVRYMKQANSGKHVAMNRAVSEAAGELFLVADSDDSFDHDALETFASVWDSIEGREDFAGVTARCRTQDGQFIGTPLPNPVLDSDNLELQFKYGVSGEKWGFCRTALLRRFPCDETLEMGAFPWARIAAAGYKTRYIDKVLRTYFIDSEFSMSKTVTVKRPMTNVYRNTETLNLAWKYFGTRPLLFVKAAFNLARFARAAGLSRAKTSSLVIRGGARLLVFLLWPLTSLKPVGSSP